MGLEHLAKLVRPEQLEQIEHLVLNAFHDAILIADSDRCVIYVNDAFTRRTGYALSDLEGTSRSLLGSGRPDEKVQAAMNAALDANGHWEGVIWYKPKSGGELPAWASIDKTADAVGEGAYFVATYRDLRTSSASIFGSDLWRLALESSLSPIFIIDAVADGMPVHFVNKAFEDVTGYSNDEVVGYPLHLFEDKAWGRRQIHEIRSSIGNRTQGSAILGSFKKNGDFYWAELSVAPVRDDAEAGRYFVGTLNDVTERIFHQRKLERQATYDDTTGLPNRSLFQDRVEQEIVYARRYSESFIIFALDIDHFNRVKHTLGNLSADMLLRALGMRLGELLKDKDTVARLEGDMFGILLPGREVEADAPRIIDAIVKSLARPFEIDGHMIDIDCSIGIAAYPGAGEDAINLVRNAESALFRAKDGGRNGIRYHDAQVNSGVVQGLKVRNELHHALDRDELFLEYQPLIDMRTASVVGCEALLRWRHPQLGIVPPLAFLPIAEGTNLMSYIGEWVLRTACFQANEWQQQGLKAGVMAVNISVRQFRQPDLVNVIARAVADAGIAPASLELEISESVAMRDVDVAVNTLDKLRHLGVRLAIDDFGTGYTSLGHLKRLPVTALKLDRTFVRDITNDPDDAAIVRGIISLAHDMSLTVTAEGVETEAQYAFLRASRCDMIQGFIFSPPVAAMDFADMLRKNSRIALSGVPADSPQRTILILDDEENIISALVRLLRRDGYSILKATSAAVAFELLAQNDVGVVISDQRMPGMSGTEFLRRVKRIYPNTIRMVLSGYTDLQSVTDAINEGAVYKFLTKPWDDEKLRNVVKDAFVYHEALTRDGPGL